LPLPTYGPVCAEAATLRRVSAAAVSKASAFMAPSVVMTRQNQTNGITLPLVLERHSGKLNSGRPWLIGDNAGKLAPPRVRVKSVSPGDGAIAPVDVKQQGSAEPIGLSGRIAIALA
jgi:hypothetical protein